MKRALPTILLAAVLVVGGLASNLTPATAAVPERAPQVAELLPLPPVHNLGNGNGYNTVVNIFGVRYVDYYWQETKYARDNLNAGFGWAEYVRIADNQWLQATAQIADLPTWEMVIPHMCHPVTGYCVDNWRGTQNDVFILTVWGWFRERPYMRIFITPQNQVGWTMISSSAP